jgi:hypothetical protein
VRDGKNIVVGAPSRSTSKMPGASGKLSNTTPD